MTAPKRTHPWRAFIPGQLAKPAPKRSKGPMR